MRVAKAKGHLRGKQPKLNPRQEGHLVELLHSGEYSTAEIGDQFGVARSTVYRAVARSKKAALATADKRPAVNASVPVPPSGCTDPSTPYRPRHGSPSEFPSQNGGRAQARRPRRPETARQTTH